MHILNIIFSTQFGYAVLRVMTPILFAALAALITDRAGVINIGLEGIMLSSALAGVIVSAYASSAFIGVLGAVGVGILLSLLLAYFSLNLKTDIILTGTAINLLADGGTVFILYLAAHDKGVSTSLKSKVVPKVVLPLIKDIPVIGPVLSNHNLLTYIALLSVLIVYILLYKTSLGLRIRAVGEMPSSAKSVGINVVKTQYIALIISGIFTGLAGAYMSMGYVSLFSRNMTAGRGFIALAAEAMGRATPLGTLAASLLFGFADSLSNSLQALRVPAEFVQMLPYAFTVICLVVYSIEQSAKLKKNKNQE